MEKTTLNGKPAVKLKAKMVIWGRTNKAHLYEVNGAEHWIPDSVCTFDKEPHNGIGNISGTLTIQEWYYNKNNKFN